MMLAAPSIAHTPSATTPVRTLDSSLSIRALGTLPSDSSSQAWAINDLGQVAGWSSGQGSDHAFLWDNGTMQALGTLGGLSSQAYGINNHGEVAGWSLNASGVVRAVLWTNGTVTDLGTLGGVGSGAEAVNDAGQVVGWSDVPSGSGPLLFHAFLWENGTMTDLGTLGGTDSVAYAINEKGQVAGYSFDSMGNKRPFLWENGTMTDLGSLGCSVYSEAHGINNAGQVVGWSFDSTCDVPLAFLYENGTMTSLGTVGGCCSQAFGMNDAGQVVGWSSDPSGDSRGFLRDGGTMTGLGTLPGDLYGSAYAINGRGQIVGISADAQWVLHAVLWSVSPPPPAPAPPIRDLGAPPGDGTAWATAVNNVGHVVGHSMGPDFGIRAFLWNNGTFQALDGLGGGETFAYGINAVDEIVGFGYNESGAQRAILWQNGTPADLGGLGGTGGAAYGINDQGQVVGWSYNATGVQHAFLWDRGTMTDLGVLPGGKSSGASSINDQGQIVGYGQDASGEIHAILWQNGTMTDLGFGSANGINNAGQIVGTGYAIDAGGQIVRDAVLWDNGVRQVLGWGSAGAINAAGQIVGYSVANGETHGFLWYQGNATDLGTLPSDTYSQASGINDVGQAVGFSSESPSHAVLWSLPTPEVHDVAVLSADVSPRAAEVGAAVTIEGVVRNQGTRPESFEASAYAGSIRIGSVSIMDLKAGSSRDVRFTWDTSTVTPMADPGYPVRLEASSVSNDEDLANNAAEGGHVILAAAVLAHASARPPATDEGLPITFTCAVSDGASPYTFHWDFGDQSDGSDSSMSHTYASAGAKTVWCMVTDSFGKSAKSEITVSVNPRPSVAISTERTAAGPGTMIQFSSNPTGGTGEYEYTWDFGDGTTDYGAAPAHGFAAERTYHVSLSIQDAVGGTAMASIDVVVSELAVTASAAQVTASTGEGVTFTARANGAGGEPYTFSWNFGDEQGDTGATVTHAYAKPGTYTPKVTVTDATGYSQEKVLATVTVDSPTSTSGLSVHPGYIGGGIAVIVIAAVVALAALRRRNRSE